MKNIIELEEKLRQAMLTSDVSSLNELISDSLVFTAPTGDIVNKQMDLEGHRSGIQKLSGLELLDQQVQNYENFAVVQAKMKLTGTYAGQIIDGIYCYTRVWTKLKDCWQVVAGHVSQIVS